MNQSASPSPLTSRTTLPMPFSSVPTPAASVTSSKRWPSMFLNRRLVQPSPVIARSCQPSSSKSAKLPVKATISSRGSSICSVASENTPLPSLRNSRDRDVGVPGALGNPSARSAALASHALAEAESSPGACSGAGSIVSNRCAYHCRTNRSMCPSPLTSATDTPWVCDPIPAWGTGSQTRPRSPDCSENEPVPSLTNSSLSPRPNPVTNRSGSPSPSMSKNAAAEEPKRSLGPATPASWALSEKFPSPSFRYSALGLPTRGRNMSSSPSESTSATAAPDVIDMSASSPRSEWV